MGSSPHRWPAFIVAVCLLIPLTVNAEARGDWTEILDVHPTPEPKAAEPEKPAPKLISVKYTRQKQLTCNGHTFNLPDFPYTEGIDTNAPEPTPEEEAKGAALLYLVASEESCSKDYFGVELALGKEVCNGAHVCTHAGFAYSNVKGVLKDEVKRAHADSTRKLKLAKGLTGYFVPPTCGTYCDGGRLIWFSKGKIYEVTSKFAFDDPKSIKDLVNSANSYIKHN